MTQPHSIIDTGSSGSPLGNTGGIFKLTNNGTAQEVPTDTVTKLTFDTLTWINQGAEFAEFVDGKIHVLIAGYYDIFSTVNYGPAGGIRTVYAVVTNGSEPEEAPEPMGTILSAAGTSPTELECTGKAVHFDVDDWIIPRVLQYSGATLTLLTNAYTPVFVMTPAVGGVLSQPGPEGPPGPAGGDYVLIETQTLESDDDSIEFSGLDGDEDGIYFIVANILNGAGGGVNYSVRPNGLTTNQLYSLQYVNSVGFTGAVMIFALDGVGSPVGDSLQAFVIISAKTGTRRIGSVQFTQVSGGVAYPVVGSVVWDETVTNIVTLEIVADAANGFKAGTVISLYKLRR